MGDFIMPSLGADMEAGTVSHWLVSPGDEVKRGDIVAVVETDKATIEVEIFETGVIDELVVGEGERVPVGTVLAHVLSTAGPLEAPAREVPPRAAPPREAALTARLSPVPPPPATLAPLDLPGVHSPVIRHLAEQLGVDLTTVSGSGPGGVVTRADVERLGEARANAARRESVTGRPPAGHGTPTRREAPPSPVAEHGLTGRKRSSPLARRLAAELGVDLATLRGTGPAGSVIERDVRRAAGGGLSAHSASTGRGEARVGGTEVSSDVRHQAMRHAIGALMARSKREIPHYYLSTTIDAGAATAWLEQANLERPVASRLVLPALLLKATAAAVAKVPEMNGFFTDGVFTPSEAVHVGVAISLRAGGVVAPAIHDTDQLSLDELMAHLHDLVGRARAGVLRSSEMSDPTITVTNLGELGVEAVFGVIYPPQVALVGFGQVTERAVAKGGMLAVRPCLTATLSADHRASDGHRGSRFLAEIDRVLQEPEKL